MGVATGRFLARRCKSGEPEETTCCSLVVCVGCIAVAWKGTLMPWRPRVTHTGRLAANCNTLTALEPMCPRVGGERVFF